MCALSALVGFHLSARSSPQPCPGQSGVNLRMPSIKGTSGSMFLFCSALEFSPTHCSSSLPLPSLHPNLQGQWCGPVLPAGIAPPASSTAVALIILWGRLFSPVSFLLLVMQLFCGLLCYRAVWPEGQCKKVAGNITCLLLPPEGGMRRRLWALWFEMGEKSSKGD